MNGWHSLGPTRRSTPAAPAALKRSGKSKSKQIAVATFMTTPPAVVTSTAVGGVVPPSTPASIKGTGRFLLYLKRVMFE